MIQTLFVTMILVTISCDDESIQMKEKEAYVQSTILPDTVNQGESFKIEFEISVSGCWTYSKLESETDGINTYIKIISKNPSERDSNVACPTGLFIETIQEQITLNLLGNNKLHFNDSTLLRTIFVKN